MIRALIENWWLLLLRGVFALAFAVFVFLLQPLFPSLMLKVMAYTAVAVIFGLLAIATGIITCIAALKGSAHKHRPWALLGDGVAITAGGLMVVLVPAITVVEVIQIISVTSLIVAIFEIITATHVRRHVKDEWFLVLGGLTSFAFSLFLFLDGTRETGSILNWIAVYAAANGLAMIGLSNRLRGLRHSIHELSSTEHITPSGKKAGAA